MRLLSSIALCLGALAGTGCRDRDGATWTLPEPERTSQTPQAVAAPSDQAIARGFRGQAHPLLDAQVTIDVIAEWSPVGKGNAHRWEYFPDPFYEPFRDLTVAAARRTYSMSDFSAFLPDEFREPGQIWSLKVESVVRLLRQFHSGASMRLAAAGRRAGPDGGFGVLRAVSTESAEIAFRLHAEFAVAPGAWLTPAHLSGSLRVDRTRHTVEFFELSIPTGRTWNATLTVRLPTEALIDIVKIDRMRLSGGAERPMESIEWDESLSAAEARDRLAQAFYSFLEVPWVPFDRALTESQRRNKPICALVLWGALDDQSC